METLYINTRVQIPISELRFRFSRSGGPGGQNVNRVSTRVELIYDMLRSSIDSNSKEILRVNLGRRLYYDGTVRIISQESRSQWKNRQTAIEKLVDLLKRALRPHKTRHPTAMTRGSVEARLVRKKGRGEVKKLRKIDLRNEE
jgi:ribosome-associated protein